MWLTDPFHASSFDHLHNNNGGLEADHILPQLFKHIELLGWQAVRWVDDM